MLQVWPEISCCAVECQSLWITDRNISHTSRNEQYSWAVQLFHVVYLDLRNKKMKSSAPKITSSIVTCQKNWWTACSIHSRASLTSASQPECSFNHSSLMLELTTMIWSIKSDSIGDKELRCTHRKCMYARFIDVLLQIIKTNVNIVGQLPDCASWLGPLAIEHFKAGRAIDSQFREWPRKFLRCWSGS